MNMLLPSQKIFLEKAKTGDILLTSSDAWYSKIIKWKTKSEFNHVGIIYRLFDRRLNIKIPFIIEAISTGVTMQPLINYFKESKNTDLYLFRHKLVNENNLPLIIGKSLEYIGANYDYQQLFALLLQYLYSVSVCCPWWVVLPRKRLRKQQRTRLKYSTATFRYRLVPRAT